MKVLVFVTLVGVTLVTPQEVPMTTTGSTVSGNTSPLPTGTPGSLSTTQSGNMMTGTNSGGMGPTSGSPGPTFGTTGTNSGSMRTTAVSMSVTTTPGNAGTTPGGMSSNSGNMGTSSGNVRTSSPGIRSTTMASVNSTTECKKKKKKKHQIPKLSTVATPIKRRNKRRTAAETGSAVVNKTITDINKLMGAVMNTSVTDLNLQRYTRAPPSFKFEFHQ